jgi:O-antigen/teichoic acid export membrane protein
VAGSYVDRYVVNHFLSLETVGVLTFYASFTNAVLTLTESGVLTFASPKLVTMYKEKDKQSFDREKNKTVRQMALGAGAIVLGVGLFVPLVGWLMDRPIFYQNAGALFLMLAGVWIQAVASVYFYVLFARKQDRALWEGNLIYLGISILANIGFVYFCGLAGVGAASILSALVLLAWRWRFVKRPQQKIYE